MRKKISFLSMIVLIILVSFAFVGCEKKKEDEKVTIEMKCGEGYWLLSNDEKSSGDKVVQINKGEDFSFSIVLSDDEHSLCGLSVTANNKPIDMDKTQETNDKIKYTIKEAKEDYTIVANGVQKNGTLDKDTVKNFLSDYDARFKINDNISELTKIFNESHIGKKEFASLKELISCDIRTKNGINDLFQKINEFNISEDQISFFLYELKSSAWFTSINSNQLKDNGVGIGDLAIDVMNILKDFGYAKCVKLSNFLFENVFNAVKNIDNDTKTRIEKLLDSADALGCNTNEAKKLQLNAHINLIGSIIANGFSKLNNDDFNDLCHYLFDDDGKKDDKKAEVIDLSTDFATKLIEEIRSWAITFNETDAEKVCNKIKNPVHPSAVIDALKDTFQSNGMIKSLLTGFGDSKTTPLEKGELVLYAGCVYSGDPFPEKDLFNKKEFLPSLVTTMGTVMVNGGYTANEREGYEDLKKYSSDAQTFLDGLHKTKIDKLMLKFAMDFMDIKIVKNR